MAAPGLRKVGRPGKGPRHVVTTRIDVHEAEKLFLIAHRLGMTVSELLAERVTEYLAGVDVAELITQEALPIAQAS